MSHILKETVDLWSGTEFVKLWLTTTVFVRSASVNIQLVPPFSLGAPQAQAQEAFVHGASSSAPAESICTRIVAVLRGETAWCKNVGKRQDAKKQFS